MFIICRRPKTHKCIFKKMHKSVYYLSQKCVFSVFLLKHLLFSVNTHLNKSRTLFRKNLDIEILLILRCVLRCYRFYFIIYYYYLAKNLNINMSICGQEPWGEERGSQNLKIGRIQNKEQTRKCIKLYYKGWGGAFPSKMYVVRLRRIDTPF